MNEESGRLGLPLFVFGTVGALQLSKMYEAYMVTSTNGMSPPQIAGVRCRVCSIIGNPMCPCTDRQTLTNPIGGTVIPW